MNHRVAIPQPQAHSQPQVPRPAPRRGAAEGERSASAQAFADVLREAEAVQDRVELTGRAPAGRTFPGAVQEAMALLLRPVPGLRRRQQNKKKPRPAPEGVADAGGA